jgi:hypothetical protein
MREKTTDIIAASRRRDNLPNATDGTEQATRSRFGARPLRASTGRIG